VDDRRHEQRGGQSENETKHESSLRTS
jgi:hypothetical protein